MEKNTKKRLFFDIETSPNIGFFWQSGYKLNVPYSNIIKERAIICICYKWEGDDKVYSLNWDKNQDDKAMLEKFVEITNEAQELVGHNGDKFDLPWIRTRCLFHGIPMFPNYVTIDTLKQARSKFRFNSNRLDYIANYLGVGGKTETGFDLWKNIVLNKDKEAMDKMVEYCKNDVIILEKVYKYLANYFPHKTHYGALENGDKCSCPECGSINLKFSQKRYSAAGTPRIQLQCRECFKYHTVATSTYDKIVANSVIS
jgi:DNA polymerase elongation subunit (family B)